MSEPIKSTKGGTDIGPRDSTRDAENPDVFVPPSTDKGLVPNLRFSFADAHMNLQDGGWSREVTQRDLRYFPAGIPHSIQGLGPDGCEFLLAFPDGTFSESSTFLFE